MSFTLEETMDDWFSLIGGVNSASIEGSPDEWAEILEAIKKGESKRFTRCAVEKEIGGYKLYSPRNASSKRDEVFVSHSEITEFVEMIEEVLHQHDMDEIKEAFFDWTN